MKIIGLIGQKGSGKSYIAKKLMEHFENEYSKRGKVVPFAAPLKQACLAMFGCDRMDNYYGDDKAKSEITEFWQKRLGPDWETYRKILVSFGTDIMRSTVHEKFWVYAFQKTLIDLKRTANPPLVFIDDVRFNNEYDFIVNDCNGICFNVQRAGTILDRNDKAENGLDNERISACPIIINDSTFNPQSITKAILTMKECPNEFSV